MIRELFDSIPGPLRKLKPVRDYVEKLSADAQAEIDRQRKDAIADIGTADTKTVKALPAIQAEFDAAQADIDKAQKSMEAALERRRAADRAHTQATADASQVRSKHRNFLMATAPAVIAKRIEAWEDEIRTLCIKPPVKSVEKLVGRHIHDNSPRFQVFDNNASIDARLAGLRAAIRTARDVLTFTAVSEAEATAALNGLHAAIPAIKDAVAA